MIRRQGDGWEFWHASGWRRMVDPNEPASEGQLRRLNKEHRLLIVEDGMRISKIDAAIAIDRLAEEQA